MISFENFNSILSLTSYFTSDEKCKQAIIESLNLTVTWSALTAAGITALPERMASIVASPAARTSPALSAQSSRTPNYHLSSGSLPCTLSAVTRRVYPHISLQGI